MTDGIAKMPQGDHDGVVKVSALHVGSASNGMSHEVSQVSDILRARSFAKLRNQSNNDLEG